jgi:UDP-N-acetylglucosamine 2-epimerase (non-hydrolysing)
MIDTLYSQLSRARAMDTAGELGLERGAYAVATLHRPSNVDEAGPLAEILEALGQAAQQMPVVLPIHPRTRRNAAAFGLGGLLGRIRTVDPLPYRAMLSLMDGAAVVMTDSGGLQEETTALGVPCVTLREQTERPVTLTEGTNRMAPWPLSAAGIMDAFHGALRQGRSEPGSASPEGWDGQAAERITAVLQARLSEEFLAATT